MLGGHDGGPHHRGASAWSRKETSSSRISATLPSSMTKTRTRKVVTVTRTCKILWKRPNRPHNRPHVTVSGTVGRHIRSGLSVSHLKIGQRRRMWASDQRESQDRGGASKTTRGGHHAVRDLHLPTKRRKRVATPQTRKYLETRPISSSL